MFVTNIKSDNAHEEVAFPFKLGLDLVGGSLLTYKADVSELQRQDIDGSITSLVENLEKRLNPFGTGDAKITPELVSVFGDGDTQNERRIIIELPGVSDPEEAKKVIGEIPVLEFKLAKDISRIALIEDERQKLEIAGLTGGDTSDINLELANESFYESTGLTGRYLKDAIFAFDSLTGQPLVSIRFDAEGSNLFADITRDNIGNILGVFLDGVPISEPVLQAEIRNGEAQISGSMSIEEAQNLARNLNYGALPVNIEPISTQSISASLGKNILDKGVEAGVIGLALVFIFMIIFYRFAGIIASASLFIYVLLLLSAFKLFGFVFTAAGIAGFIISVGMAVDANILIFERIKEELKDKNKTARLAVIDGFARAWMSIRDGNVSSILTAIILFYMTTSLVKGFALTFGIGVLFSMISAILITRIFLLALAPNRKNSKFAKLFFGIK